MNQIELTGSEIDNLITGLTLFKGKDGIVIITEDDIGNVTLDYRIQIIGSENEKENFSWLSSHV